MANSKDTDILFIIGGAIALIAGLFGANYLGQKHNNMQSQVQKQGIEPQPKSSCNKCPFSK